MVDVTDTGIAVLLITIFVMVILFSAALALAIYLPIVFFKFLRKHLINNKDHEKCN